MNSAPRLNRLFAADGRCFDVALDHGMFNQPAMIQGIEEIRAAIFAIVAAEPDAIQLTPGLAPVLQAIAGKAKPALVLRTDIANVYGRALPRYVFSRVIGEPVEQAVALDAACVVVNLLLLPDQPELHAQCIEHICRLKPACERFGMPLMIEPLVMRDNAGGGYMVDGSLDLIVALVRQAVELGANIIKADPCDDVAEYHRVIEVAAGVPVLVRGGGKAGENEILQRTYDLLQQGAAGIVYGRNIIQHSNPHAMTRALMAIVHGRATPADAARILNNEAPPA